ncbi:MAG: TonB-dependent receptor [Proteobacteria bacterium]|nr:TonB-dependent receptor [Pseudomonadota bacterium]
MISKLNKNRALLSSSVSMGVIALFAISGNAYAQETKTKANETVIVTGSSIKRKVLDNALPLQIVTQADLQKEGIVSAEQLSMYLTASSTGPDNLASNADVVSGSQRGLNGVSAANLRGQGSSGTLVLFNGRRIASNGLSGSVVDLNQIPLSAIERVDVLKDGASAIYGTDAIGGVINYITKKDYKGLTAQAFTDITEQGGGNIFRYSLTGGFGDLDTQHFNIMASASYSDNKILNGTDRDWVNGFQPNRGLSIDTRGTPFATIFPFNANTAAPSGTLFGNRTGSTNLSPFLPGSTTVRANGGVNLLDIPGGAGCDSIDGMQAYDELLWNTPSAAYACAWDTGRAVVIQQPITKKNFLTKGIYRIGEHEISAELMLSESVAAKKFSNPQLTSSDLGTSESNSRFFYPLNPTTKATYDNVFNTLSGVSSAWASFLAPRYGLPIGFRWRCDVCGQREIETTSKTGRYFLGADGPLGAGWNYRTGASYAWSETSSLLGSGYYYRHTTTPSGNGADKVGKVGIVDVLNSGIVNVFLPAGQTQSAAALAALESASAKGVTLYGGKYSVTSIDGSASGPLFELPGGRVYGAVGFDLRKEEYNFNGDSRAIQPEIFLAPFDNQNALTPKSRTVNALYAELALPIIKNAELTLAARRDEYSGFGSTTNPKISFKYRPFDKLLFRSSYNTGFRVPSFNQIFNGNAISTFVGNTLADPAKCPGGVQNPAVSGCEAIHPEVVSGGNVNLQPEKAKQYSYGFVIEPTNNYSLTLDWWHIERSNSIFNFLSDFGVAKMAANYELFKDRFYRDGTGAIVLIDGRYGNAGGSITEGLEVGAKGRGEMWGGKWSVSMDGTYLLTKKSRALDTAPWGASEIGVFTLAGDLGIKWKHNISATYSKGNWTGTLSQIFRKGYTNGRLPGVAAGTVTPPDLVTTVDDYSLLNASLTYRGFKNTKIVAGVRNILDQDPPFAITYDSNGGSGGNWEPRVADPRGRSFTLLLEYKF